MTERLSGRDGLAPILYLPGGRNHASFLIWSLSEEAKITVQLSAAHTRLLLEMQRALEADGHLEGPARGWRRPEQLALAVAGSSDLGYPVEAQTIRAYLSQMQRVVRDRVQALGKAVAVPSLFERRRGIGARLSTEQFVVIDGTKTAPATEPVT